MRKISSLFILFLYILSSYVYCYANETNIEYTASRLSQFANSININTPDLNEYLKKVFNYKPELEFYYKGYSSSSIANNHNVEFMYTNQEIPFNRIHIAKDRASLKDILSTAMLYAENKLYVISYETVDIKSLFSEISSENQIVTMGYNGFNASSFSSKITDNTCYNITIHYSIDQSELLEYKRQTERKAFEIVIQNIAKSMPDYIKERIIHDYIIDNTQYSDADGELAYLPYNALINGKGVCSAYALSGKILFDLVGIENIYVTGTGTNSHGTENHGWNIVKLDDEYYHIDITWNDPVSFLGINLSNYEYYNVTDSQIANNHTWDREKYPVCNGTKYKLENTITLKKNEFNDYYTKEDLMSVFDIYKPFKYTNYEYNTEITSEYTLHHTESNKFIKTVSSYKLYVYIIIIFILLKIYL